MRKVSGSKTGATPSVAYTAGAARTVIIAVGSLLLVLTLACAQSNSAGTEVVRVAPAPVLTDSFPPNETSFPHGVRARGDVAYAALPGYRPLTLDLYMPPDTMAPPAAGFALIVFVHGGAWMGGHARHAGAIDGFPRYLAGLAARGYVVASVNYRLSGEARFPASLLDLKRAVRWLRQREEEFRIDRNNVVLWGASAGGQLAALAGLACDAPEFQVPDALTMSGAAALVDGADCVQGVALWYTPTDFMISRASVLGSSPDSPEARYFGCVLTVCDIALLEDASAVNFVDSGDPPILIVHGRSDEVVPFAHAAELEARLRAAGVHTDFLAIDGVGHSFIGAAPEQTRGATLLALAATESFFARVTGAAAEMRAPAD